MRKLLIWGLDSPQPLEIKPAVRSLAHGATPMSANTPCFLKGFFFPHHRQTLQHWPSERRGTRWDKKSGGHAWALPWLAQRQKQWLCRWKQIEVKRPHLQTTRAPTALRKSNEDQSHPLLLTPRTVAPSCTLTHGRRERSQKSWGTDNPPVQPVWIQGSTIAAFKETFLAAKSITAIMQNSPLSPLISSTLSPNKVV